MTFTCSDLEEALLEGEALLGAAREHAQSCDACREALLAWDAVSDGAASMRRSWDSPELWPRIHQALAEESEKKRARQGRLAWPTWRLLPMAAGILFAVGVAGPLLLRGPDPSPGPVALADDELLSERALEQVERSEAEYTAAIERLAGIASARLETPASPVLASYREKLQILDAAIADCRAQVDRNRFNAHLRQELLTIYQEKQRTLERIMEERS